MCLSSKIANTQTGYTLGNHVFLFTAIRHQNIAVVINMTTIMGSRLSPVFLHTVFRACGAGEGTVRMGFVERYLKPI